MPEADETEKGRKERSPSFPFISLKKAIERAQTLYDNHRREPARVTSVAKSWGYGSKSSGLLQTVAALKQFGLVEDLGRGPDRKVQITELARRILMDARPGAREAALREAAKSPRLVAEYLPKWLPKRPSDDHCISELELDRGFNSVGAKLFLRVFDETVSYANLMGEDSLSEDLDEGGTLDDDAMIDAYETNQPPPQGGVPGLGTPIAPVEQKPFAQRMKIGLTENSLTVSAILVNPTEIDKLVKILEANKALLGDEATE